MAVVTSCRKLAWSLRSGQMKPSFSKKGTASLTGPWNISSLQTGAGRLPREHIMQLKHTMHAQASRALDGMFVRWRMGMLVPNKGQTAQGDSGA